LDEKNGVTSEKHVKASEERAILKAKEAEEKARKEAERAAKEKAEREAIEARERAKREAEEAKKARTVLYEGMVKLVITPPVDFNHIKELEEGLRQFEDLRLVLIGGSIKEGAHIIVSTEKPAALINILKQIPRVQETVSRGNKIQVTLK
jgi:sRNA-binding protein